MNAKIHQSEGCVSRGRRRRDGRWRCRRPPAGRRAHYHLGEIVGSPSSGANGNVRHIYLPGGVEVMLTGLRAIRHDGGQFHNVGVRPTVPVERTLVGVREGLDEVLLRGLAVARAP